MAGEVDNVGGPFWDVEERPMPVGAMPSIEDAEGNARTQEQIEKEAEEYRGMLEKM